MESQADFYLTIERFGASVALIAPGREVTYAALAALADDYGRKLGTVRCLVFLEASNEVDAIAAYLGALRAGHVVYLFAQADAAWFDELVKRYRPAVVLRHRDGAMVEHRIDQPGQVPLHPDLRVLLSTSGSTGSPKFVKLSHRNLCANAASICTYLGMTASDRAMTSLRFHYSYGMSVVHTHLAAGGALILTDASVNTAPFWEQFARHRATSFAGVPYSFDLLSTYAGWEDAPGLRYVTQAGGRLAPDMVRRLAAMGEARGWQFFVMYGQTEAAPRMAWLPPSLAQAHPDCIGLPVPGGSLVLLDPQGHEIVDDGREGELVYLGPNVMMGYARSADDLASDETPAHLLTGDIAERVAGGLFRIVGRSSRFVKPFGVRLNLDELQALVRAELPDAVCAGTDEQVVVATTHQLDLAGRMQVQKSIAALCKLPAFAVVVIVVATMPSLSNQKPDYQTILSLRHAPAAVPSQTTWKAFFGHVVRLGSSPRLYRQAVVEAKAALGFGASDWEDVRAIFARVAPAAEVQGSASFQSLAGDSLSYVQVSLALEQYLGHLPDGWETLSVDELEASRTYEAVL